MTARNELLRKQCATQHPVVMEAVVDVLRQGGNAADAALAADLAEATCFDVIKPTRRRDGNLALDALAKPPKLPTRTAQKHFRCAYSSSSSSSAARRSPSRPGQRSRS